LPDAIQLVQTFAGAIVVGTKESESARRLISYLASPRAALAIRNSGMDAAARTPTN
jgi:molybdate transport system substrate-binding protein